MDANLIALLGRREKPTDGIEDYCRFLGEALSRQSVAMKTERVDWDDVGWIAALRKLRTQTGNVRGEWIVVHYTALSWSRHGFPLGLLFVLALLRYRGLHCAVLFHESERQLGRARLRDRIRGRIQEWVIRGCFRFSEKAIFTVPLETISWLRGDISKACYIPIGANIPERIHIDHSDKLNADTPKSVAVFCLSSGERRAVEIADMALAARRLRTALDEVQFVVLGKGSSEARTEIEAALRREGVEVRVLGRLPADDVANTLAVADVLLFLGAWVTQTRGSALAAVACGLPIVGYAGPSREPIHDAGVLLAPPRDPEALAAALSRVLKDDALRSEMRRKSITAQESHFSWNTIATSFIRALSPERASATNILLFSRDFLPKRGGIQTVVADLARGLTESTNSSVERAFDVTVMTETAGPDVADGQFPFRIIRQAHLPTMARLIRRADVVHLAGPAMKPLALSLILRKPVVVEHHGFQTICPNGQLFYEPSEHACPGHYMAGRYRQCVRCTGSKMSLAKRASLLASTPIRRWLCNHAQANIVPTNWLASQLKLQRQAFVPHGVSITAAGPSIATGTHSTAFGFIGRLVSTKGIRILLQAFEKLCNEGRSPSLVIIGSGPDEESLRKFAAQFGDRVQFLGEVPPERLQEALAHVTTVVMPSLAGEVFGLVALENMMRERLLIVSDLGSLREVIGDAGLVFPTGDVTSLAGCMRWSMDNPSHARALARAGRERAQQVFNDRQMIENHISLYSRVLRSKEGNNCTRPLAERVNGN